MRHEPRSARNDELWVCHLGSVRYGDGLALQQRIRSARQAGELPDVLLLLEHPPVYTRGRRTGEGEMLLDEGFYTARGIELFDTDRGGRLTYHGPGQLVGYPIMAVGDVLAHLRNMERAIVAALAGAGLASRARPEDGPDYTGVWVDERKIASLGVHVSRGVSTHGFAVNVENDLEPFSWVVACGLHEVSMTSLQRELGGGEGLACFRKRMAYAFCSEHRRRQRLVSPARLGVAPALPTGGAPAGAEPSGSTPPACASSRRSQAVPA
jgi:lipoyl(octanoyl) transferase